MVSLWNRTTANCVIGDLTIRSTFGGRLVGYLASRSPNATEGMLLWNASRVHTLFMAFDLDLYFLDQDLIVMESRLGVSPFRFPTSPDGCRHVLEIPSGAPATTHLRVGDRLGLA